MPESTASEVREHLRWVLSKLGLYRYHPHDMVSCADCGVFFPANGATIDRHLTCCRYRLAMEASVEPVPESKPKKRRVFGNLVALLRQPIEDGVTHPAEEVIGKWLFTDRSACCDWLSRATRDSGGYIPSTIATIMRIVGRLEFDLVGQWGLRVVDEWLQHSDVEVREAAVRALEAWGGSKAFEILCKHVEAVPWLNEYVVKVLRDLSDPTPDAGEKGEEAEPSHPLPEFMARATAQPAALDLGQIRRLLQKYAQGSSLSERALLAMEIARNVPALIAEVERLGDEADLLQDGWLRAEEKAEQDKQMMEKQAATIERLEDTYPERWKPVFSGDSYGDAMRSVGAEVGDVMLRSQVRKLGWKERYA